MNTARRRLGAATRTSAHTEALPSSFYTGARTEHTRGEREREREARTQTRRADRAIIHRLITRSCRTRPFSSEFFLLPFHASPSRPTPPRPRNRRSFLFRGSLLSRRFLPPAAFPVFPVSLFSSSPTAGVTVVISSYPRLNVRARVHIPRSGRPRSAATRPPLSLSLPLALRLSPFLAVFPSTLRSRFPEKRVVVGEKRGWPEERARREGRGGKFGSRSPVARGTSEMEG